MRTDDTDVIEEALLLSIVIFAWARSIDFSTVYHRKINMPRGRR